MSPSMPLSIHSRKKRFPALVFLVCLATFTGFYCAQSRWQRTTGKPGKYAPLPLLKATTVYYDAIFNGIISMAYNPLEKYFALGMESGYVNLYDFQGKFLRTFKAHAEKIPHISISADGRSILTAGEDGRVNSWSRSGRRIGSKFHGVNAGKFVFAGYSPRGKTFAYIHGSHLYIKKLDGNKFHKIKMEKPTCAAFSPDGVLAALGNHAGVTRLYSIQSGKMIRVLEDRKTSGIKLITFSPDGKKILSTSLNNDIHIMNLRGDILKKILSYSFRNTNLNYSMLKGELVNRAAFFPDGNRIFLGMGNGRAVILNSSGSVEAGGQIHMASVIGLAFIKHKSLYITASEDGRILFWREKVLGKALRAIRAHRARVRSLALDSEGKILIWGSDDKLLKISSFEKTFPEYDIKVQGFKGHRKPITALAISKKGNIIFAGDATGSVKLWRVGLRNTFMGFLIRRPRTLSSFETEVTALRSGSGGLFLGGDARGNVILWSESGKRLRKIRGFGRKVTSLAFSNNGKFFGIGYENGIFRLYATRGKIQFEKKAHTGAVRSIMLDKSGGRAVSLGADKRVQFWNLKGGLTGGFQEDAVSVFAYSNFIHDRVITVSTGGFLTIRRRNGAIIKRYRLSAKGVRIIDFSSGRPIFAFTGDEKKGLIFVVKRYFLLESYLESK